MPKQIEIIGDCTLYLGDCMDIVPTLGKVDALVTDPPYGIAHLWKGGGGHGWGKSRTEGIVRNKWDEFPLGKEELRILSEIAPIQIIWGGNYFPLPPSRCWLIWNKPERGFSLAEAEMAWTNMDKVVRVFDCNRSDTGREHPTQKPLKLMQWCLDQIPYCQSIIDPFMGSGTTLVACAKMGRKGIGIELDQKYFDLACKRVEESYKQGDLFMPTVQAAKQEKLI